MKNPGFNPNLQPVPQLIKTEIKDTNIKNESEMTFVNEQKVRDWSEKWIEVFYNEAKSKNDNINFSKKLEFANSVESTIAKIVGEMDSFDNGLLRPEYKKGVHVFLNTIIDFVDKKSNDGKDQIQVKNFIKYIYDTFFSFSPNLSNKIGTENLLLLASKANRTPEIQGWLGQNMVGELVYELNWSKDGIEKDLAKKILEQKPSEILDILEQLETVGAHAAGEMYDASNALKKIRKIIDTIKNSEGSQIQKYASMLAKETLEQESTRPSLGFITYQGNKEHGRISKRSSEEIVQEHLKIAGQVDPNIPVDGYMMFVASDSIAVFDHSFTPRKIGLVDANNLPEPQKVSIVALRNTLETLKDESTVFRHSREIIAFINNRILIPLNLKQIENIDREVINNLTEQLSKIESDLTTKLTPVDFENYNNATLNKNINPFSNGQDEKQFSLLLQHLHQPRLREKIEQDLKIDLKKIPLRSQIQFLSFLTTQNNEGFDRLRKILQENISFQDSFLKSFLSMSGDETMGDKILTLGEKLPKESAEKLFSKYGEIIDEVGNIAEYLSKSIGEKATPEILESAQNHLLIKGRDLLSGYAKNADSCKDEECEDLGRELESKLANIKSSLLLFASACKSLSEQKLLSIEDLANTDLDVVHGGLEQSAQEEMMRIFKENRPHYPPELLLGTISEFENALKNTNENQTWYVLRNGGDIASFMRLDNMPDGSIYGASFNVRTELRGSTIGSELLKKIIEEKSEKQPFKIVCYEKNPMLKKYEEDFKFKIIGTIENYHNTGEKFYDMVREPKINND